ncbi:hypothetical protein MTsPCn9_12320 [Croceitalea sp. MTPC9]|uniref:DUF4350 domain-containing protein n=1 Tax=unclassified Croceitalea TaxID=2632280 RepID=UPI002B39FE20|nr:hypothetical protein MTsPCn6_31320 [Croceitalea sp. MTPC6]GMN16296.1 hypothetical protein MTsPCn9_12320 [Croceitalea sp. MTPC9]
MDKRSKIIIIIFAVVLVGIIVTEITRPKPINWRPSYTSESKIPFGCYVLYNELPQLFSKTKTINVNESVYDLMVERDSTQSSNYLLINNNIQLDKQETNQLLNYVSKGNSVFIAATSFSYFLKDTLNVELASNYSLVEDTVTVELTHKKFKAQKFELSRGASKTYFSSVDTLNTEILGYVKYVNKNSLTAGNTTIIEEPNFIRTKFGNGYFYFHTAPEAYSNYYMLKGNKDYASNTFSYINDNLLYWDDYKKAGRVVIDSPMRFVLNQTALKWVYYLTMGGLLLFVIFKAKREQRIIPVIKPLENSSVEFARTVGTLYHQNKDYTNLINKKLNYFLADLRNRYFIDTTTLNEKSIHQLAAKSGKSVEEVKKLIEFILYLKNETVHSEQDTIELTKKITAFKN